MEELKGCIEDIVFHNENNGYLVAQVSTEDEILVTVVGNLPFAREGSTFVFFGKTIEHPVYGQQFAFDEYKEYVPDTLEGIEAFIGSGSIKGIGPKLANSIVRKFGEKTLEIMEKEPRRLLEVNGIGEKLLPRITESFREHIQIRSLLVFFRDHGIPVSLAPKVFKQYGAASVKVIEENPFRLVDDVWGIGFRIADEISEKLGIERDSDYRIESGVRYVLNRESMEGNTYVVKERLVEMASQILRLESSQIIEVLDMMPFKGLLRIEKLDGRDCVFLMSFFRAETKVCSSLLRLLREDHKALMTDIEGLIARAESELGIELELEQALAVRSAAENGVCVITGGPGTGKTTIINTIIKMFEECDFAVSVAAPTGRAAKRITETSGFEAKTIHRLLEYTYSGDEEKNWSGFARNEDNPLEADVIIIDEASMIDILLMNALLNGIKPGARLILVGDADQLPPVGAGNVLRDIIESELIHTVKLNRIFRQAGESLIVVNAHRINKGEYPYFNEKDSDFFMLKRGNGAAVVETVKELCSKRLPKYFDEDFDPKRDIQVVTPVKKGISGTISLNQELQEVLNPSREGIREKQLKNRTFREGDKVMQIRNNYDIEWKRIDDLTEGQGIFNGDIGYIYRIDNEYNEITVVFEDVKAALYDATRFDELELAYAVTVHKSQGSEYPVVIMPVMWVPPVLATRNLLYTAVTRARSMVVMVGNPQIMNEMVDNNSITERNSGLKSRLRVFLDFE